MWTLGSPLNSQCLTWYKNMWSDIANYLKRYCLLMTAFVTLSLGPCSYVYIYMYMYVCIHAYIYIDLYRFIFTYIYIFIFLHTHICTYIYIYTWYMVNVVFEMLCVIHAWLRRSIFKILAGPQVEGVERGPCISPALGEQLSQNPSKSPERWSHDWDSLGPTEVALVPQGLTDTFGTQRISDRLLTGTSRPAKIAVPAKAAGVWQYESGCLREVNRFVLMTLW